MKLPGPKTKLGKIAVALGYCAALLLASARKSFKEYAPPVLGILVLIGLIVLGFRYISPDEPVQAEPEEQHMPPARLEPPVLHPTPFKKGTVT